MRQLFKRIFKREKIKDRKLETGNRKRRYWASAMLLAGALALSACKCGSRAVPVNADASKKPDVSVVDSRVPDVSAPDAACKLTSSAKPGCPPNEVRGVLQQGETLLLHNFGIRFVDIENHAGDRSAIVDVLGADCTILKKEKLRENQVKTMALAALGQYDVSAKNISPDSAKTKWINLAVTLSNCGQCMPSSCSSPKITMITLKKGETATLSGTTFKAKDISQNLFPYNESTCLVSNEKVELTVTFPNGPTSSVTVLERSCQVVPGSQCLTISVNEISQTTQNSNGTCTATDEKVTLEISQGSP